MSPVTAGTSRVGTSWRGPWPLGAPRLCIEPPRSAEIYPRSLAEGPGTDGRVLRRAPETAAPTELDLGGLRFIRAWRSRAPDAETHSPRRRCMRGGGRWGGRGGPGFVSALEPCGVHEVTAKPSCLTAFSLSRKLLGTARAPLSWRRLRWFARFTRSLRGETG